MKPKKDCFVHVTQLSYHKSMQNKSVQTPVVYQNFVTRQFQITEKWFLMTKKIFGRKNYYSL